jgi:hypothetical protein
MKTPLILSLTVLIAILAPTRMAAQTWVKTSAPTNYWVSIASSADGSKLAATASFGGIYFSADSGTNWIQTSAPTNDWGNIAMSADGTKLVAASKVTWGDNGEIPGSIYISTNSGSNWVISSAPSNLWHSVASSADGSKLVAGTGAAGIYYSTNGGLTWSASNASSDWSDLWVSITSSADGAKLLATSHSGPILRSLDYGATWNNVHLGYSAASGASSADGKRLTTVQGGNFMVSRSDDSGTNWAVIFPPYLGNSKSVASSANGMNLVAATYQAYLGGPGSVFTSIDGGLTWLPTNVPDDYWNSVASSADGARLVAAAYGDQFTAGSIYVSQSIPKSLLNIKSKGSNLVVSWMVPSRKFVLQMNSDLSTTNWVSLTNVPTLNMTNLQNEVVLPPFSNNGFFRLISQ